MRLFEDSWKRIERSAVHAKAFVKEFDSLFSNRGYSVAFKQESPETVVASVVFAVEPHTLENSLALELGECFYQLRGALDAAVWKAVPSAKDLSPSTPLPVQTGWIFRSVVRENSRIALSTNSNSLRNSRIGFERLRPDSAEKPQDDPDLGLNVTLETVHNIARKDRHRRLHVAAAIPMQIDYGIEGVPSDLRVVSAESIASDFLKGDYEFMRFGLESPSGLPITQAKLATGVTIDVVLEGIPPWSDEGFLGELKRCGMATEHVIEKFEAAFEGAGPSGVA